MMAHGIPDDNDQKNTEHSHDWQTLKGWGVVIGICRCKKCGKIAQRDDFPGVNWEES